jgi:hypothetical protein
MRGLKQLRCARVISAGHAFIQNIRRGHYETRGRRRSKSTGHGCLRRACPGDLTNRINDLACSDFAQRNSPPATIPAADSDGRQLGRLRDLGKAATRTATPTGSAPRRQPRPAALLEQQKRAALGRLRGPLHGQMERNFSRRRNVHMSICWAVSGGPVTDRRCSPARPDARMVWCLA